MNTDEAVIEYALRRRNIPQKWTIATVISICLTLLVSGLSLYVVLLPLQESRGFQLLFYTGAVGWLVSFLALEPFYNNRRGARFYELLGCALLWIYFAPISLPNLYLFLGGAAHGSFNGGTFEYLMSLPPLFLSVSTALLLLSCAHKMNALSL